jgi:hypothetical protein
VDKRCDARAVRLLFSAIALLKVQTSKSLIPFRRVTKRLAPPSSDSYASGRGDRQARLQESDSLVGPLIDRLLVHPPRAP